MTLDTETREALWYAGSWFDQGWHYAVQVREQNSRREQQRTMPRVRKPAPRAPGLTTAQRRETTRRHKLGHAPAVIARAIGATWPAVRKYLGMAAT